MTTEAVVQKRKVRWADAPAMPIALPAKIVVGASIAIAEALVVYVQAANQKNQAVPTAPAGRSLQQVPARRSQRRERNAPGKHGQAGIAGSMEGRVCIDTL